jgi:hypothetical protein
MPRLRQGEYVTIAVPINNRIALYKKHGKPGSTTITLSVDAKRYQAVTDELGGNVWIEATSQDGEPVFVPLAEGEWVRA